MLGFLKKVLTLHQLLGASVGLVPPPGARRSASVSGKVLSIESSTAKQCYCPRAHACAWLPRAPPISLQAARRRLRPTVHCFPLAQK